MQVHKMDPKAFLDYVHDIDLSVVAEHPELAAALDNLGWGLGGLGDSAAARREYERALRIYEVASGPDHPRVASVLDNLGWALRELGDMAAARLLHERALRIFEAAYGPEHPRTAIAMKNLGGALIELGDPAGVPLDLTGTGSARSELELPRRVREASILDNVTE